MSKTNAQIKREIEIELKLEQNEFDFPDGLTADAVLTMPLEEILYHILDVSAYSFGEFITAFVKAGGSLSNLTLKVIDDMGGYPRVAPDDQFTSQEEQYMEILLALTLAGSEDINMDEFVESIECLGADTKEQFYDALNEAGIEY